MTWEIVYHKDVEDDLESVGPSAARRIMQTIDEKLTQAPEKFGAPLSNNLKNFRKLRIGDFRVVYQVFNKKVIVFVLAVGPRRDKEIYRSASKRI
ncbi:MAG: type II toxin-antitoxin system RelE/ParE family toxin [Desulfobacterales bacterium]|nr:type II toxin-antitoxin system RelE/ParE family toxin [Desulfobacterales bacterium]